jgi:hypothetical protein
MEREAEFLDKLRYKTRLVSARHLADELGSPLYHGAMVRRAQRPVSGSFSPPAVSRALILGG